MLKIKCKGTPYTIGKTHGSLARQQVLRSVEFYKRFFKETAHMEWEEVINEAEKWERWLLDNCKDLADEMRGVADGAYLSEYTIYALNLRTEIAYGLAADGCTAVSFHNPDATPTGVLAQNWDWRTAQAQNLVHLQIRPGRKDWLPDVDMITEAGIIGKIGMNSNGIGVCLNAIRAPGVAYDRLPVHLALRLALYSPHKEASRIVEDLESFGIASSAHILIADANSAVGLESSSQDTIRVEPRVFGPSHVVAHTNHYVHKHVIDDKDILPDSKPRLARADKLLHRIQNAAEPIPHICRLLSDTKGAPQSICRTATEEDQTQTLFSVAMDLQNKTGQVYIGRPGIDPVQFLTLEPLRDYREIDDALHSDCGNHNYDLLRPPWAKDVIFSVTSDEGMTR